MTMRRFEIDANKVPNLPGMMIVTIEALKDLGGSANIKELNKKVIDLEGVTEEEQAFTMKGKENMPRVDYYLHWARSYLKKGDALNNSSWGVWTLTTSGKNISRLEEVKIIYEQVRKEARERALAKKQAEKESDIDIDQSEVNVNESEIDSQLQDAEDWKSTLLLVLGAMQPDAFERLSRRLLREAGFTKVEVRGQSGDGGIDGLGVLPVNLISFNVYFQCKRWKGSVGPKEIRDFRGALQGRANSGLFITTGYFTSKASDEATREGAIAIDLVDGSRLCDLLKKHKLGVETESIESVQVQPNWFDDI